MSPIRGRYICDSPREIQPYVYKRHTECVLNSWLNISYNCLSPSWWVGEGEGREGG